MSAIENRTINTKEEFWSLVTENEDGLKVFDFKRCTFNCEIRITDKEVFSLSFISCVFYKDFRLETDVKGFADFKETVFHWEVLFRDLTFYGGASFWDTSFNGDVSFAGSTFQKDTFFVATTFQGRADFWFSTFNGNGKFIFSIFKGGAFFGDSIFKQTLDFSNAKFNTSLDFRKATFFGKAFFTETEFKENVLFTDALIKDDIVFRGTIFKSGLDLSLAVITGQINSFDIQLENYESIDNSIKEPKPFAIKDKNKRETFRILKHHNIKQSNSIDYIEFARKEHAAYASELWKRIKGNPFVSMVLWLLKIVGFPFLILSLLIKWLNKKFNLKEFFTILSDYLIFSLNRYSNNHGTSYWRGIAFTFFVGWFFFYCSLLTIDNFKYNSFDWEVCKSYFKYYFDFMNPTHRIDYLGKDAGAWSYLWDFLGRVFKTVQAFRKYKKG